MEKSLKISFEDTGSQSLSKSHYLSDGRTTEKAQSFCSKKKKTQKIRNFHKDYLDIGLWPDQNQNNSRRKYHHTRKKLASFKENLLAQSESKKPAQTADSSEKYNLCKVALNQALQLTSMLLKKLAQ